MTTTTPLSQRFICLTRRCFSDLVTRIAASVKPMDSRFDGSARISDYGRRHDDTLDLRLLFVPACEVLAPETRVLHTSAALRQLFSVRRLLAEGRSVHCSCIGRGKYIFILTHRVATQSLYQCPRIAAPGTLSHGVAVRTYMHCFAGIFRAIAPRLSCGYLHKRSAQFPPHFSGDSPGQTDSVIVNRPEYVT
jgi:hypothetical protein